MRQGTFGAARGSERKAMDSNLDFGANLRQARERRGVSLRQIADSTKISMGALEALERNDIARLPGGIFVRAFVRAYSAEVGLDPEQTVREFLAQCSLEGVADGTPAANEPAEHDTFESHQRMASTLLWLVVSTLLIAPLIVYMTMRGGAGDAPSPGAETSDGVGVSSDPPQAGGVPDGGNVEPVGAAPVLVETAATGPLTIDIHPQGRCWVSLTLDGELVFDRVMQGGEREIREARQEIILSVGDAGVFAFALNRRPGRSLGGRGEAVWDVRINRENYRNFVTQ